MNENEIGRIAAAVNALRPDWPIASLQTLLRQPELARRPRLDVALALVWVACDSTTKTPARVKEHGPWWTAANNSADTGATPRPPRSTEACRLCGKHLHHCICDQPQTRPPDTTAPTPAYLTARQQLAERAAVISEDA